MGDRGRVLPAELLDQVADEAARVMAEHGIRDFALAKRKAAERLGLSPRAALPSNALVQQRLVARLRLFEPDVHDARIAKMRRLATDIMGQLEQFRPKLVGAVLDGTATINSAIELHVFSDSPELVAATLEAIGRRLHDSQRRYRFGPDDSPQIPGFELTLEDEEIQIMVFPERGSHHAPQSPIDGRPMRRASRAAVIALLDPVER
ncbi:MAG TPA: hypothetical protein VHH11_09045 [Gammaproteobacteria bacterium]|jgi:hypothetical protein|nr:hypothetical protein [Gammaproteobacteria bacterium]